METTTIGSRADFAQWAIERANAIIAEQGGNLAVAARDGGDDDCRYLAGSLRRSAGRGLKFVVR